jgi:hypothetical protein
MAKTNIQVMKIGLFIILLASVEAQDKKSNSG